MLPSAIGNTPPIVYDTGQNHFILCMDCQVLQIHFRRIFFCKFDRAQRECMATKMSRLEAASFFSGIGGFDLGFERAGLKVVWQCEINEFCRDILQQHWPKVPCVKDIKEIANEKEAGSSIPDASVWVGGFPCQDVSLARGNNARKGLRGKQSGLFFDFAKLIAARIPPTVVIENVAGLLSSHGGRDFEIVISTLAKLRYGVGWRVFNSRYFGAPPIAPKSLHCCMP